MGRRGNEGTPVTLPGEDKARKIALIAILSALAGAFVVWIMPSQNQSGGRAGQAVAASERECQAQIDRLKNEHAAEMETEAKYMRQLRIKMVAAEVAVKNLEDRLQTQTTATEPATAVAAARHAAIELKEGEYPYQRECAAGARYTFRHDGTRYSNVEVLGCVTLDPGLGPCALADGEYKESGGDCALTRACNGDPDTYPADQMVPVCGRRPGLAVAP